MAPGRRRCSKAWPWALPPGPLGSRETHRCRGVRNRSRRAIAMAEKQNHCARTAPRSLQKIAPYGICSTAKSPTSIASSTRLRKTPRRSPCCTSARPVATRCRGVKLLPSAEAQRRLISVAPAVSCGGVVEKEIRTFTALRSRPLEDPQVTKSSSFILSPSRAFK